MRVNKRFDSSLKIESEIFEYDYSSIVNKVIGSFFTMSNTHHDAML